MRQLLVSIDDMTGYWAKLAGNNHVAYGLQEYYRALMRCKALLVVLSGGQKMLIQRGSTAISTAVTAQIPLIISDAALAAYGYVSPDVAFQVGVPCQDASHG